MSTDSALKSLLCLQMKNNSIYKTWHAQMFHELCSFKYMMYVYEMSLNMM